MTKTIKLPKSRKAAAVTPADMVADIMKAARPALDDEGHIVKRVDLARALLPVFGPYTVADAVSAIGLIRVAASSASEETGDGNVLFSVQMLLEDFASTARASGPACVAARAYLVMMAADDDSWGLSSEGMRAVTRHLHGDIGSLQAGKFHPEQFGDAFSEVGWLYLVVSQDDTGAASKLAASIHAGRDLALAKGGAQ